MVAFLPLLSIFAWQTSCSSRLVVGGLAAIINFLLVLLDIPLIGRLLVVTSQLPVIWIEIVWGLRSVFFVVAAKLPAVRI